MTGNTPLTPPSSDAALMEAVLSLALDSGVVGNAIAAGGNSFTDSTKSWAANIHQGKIIKVVGLNGRSQQASIQGNSANSLIIRGTWAIGIEAGSKYVIVNADFAQILRDVLGGGGNVTAANPLQVFDPKVWGSVSGLVVGGTVTAVPGANQFTIPTLAGLGAGKFIGVNPWYAYVYRDAGGLAAAPQGEYLAVTAYITATGDFTTGAFTAAVGIGDEVLIMHPALLGVLVLIADLAVPAADAVANLLERDVIGNKADTHNFVVDAASSLMRYLKAVLNTQGLCYRGTVTAIPGANQFTIPTLAGLGAGAFDAVGGEPYRAFVFRDAGGASAAPQGERQNVTDYVTATGAFTTNAFTAAVAAGDEILILHPDIAESAVEAMRGGAETLESIDDELDAILDYAQVRTLGSPVTLTGAVQYIYTNSPGRPFYFSGGYVSRATGAWAGGESVTITVQVMIDGVNWVTVWTITFAAEPNPVLAGVPANANSALLNIPRGFWNNGNGVRVGIIQTVVGAGFHTWNHSFIDGVPGS